VDLHVVQGGIGKQIAFTSILDKLENNICVSSFWNKIFLNQPKIEAIYSDYSWDSFDGKKIYESFRNIIHVEPYFNKQFLKREIHLIEAYHSMLNLKCDGLYHNVVFSEKEEHFYSKFIEELGDYILIQFTGSDKDFNRELNELGSRNLDLDTAQDVINILSRDLGKRVIEVNNGNQQFENTFVPRKRPEYREYLMMTKHCQSFIGIDSCLNHMSAFKENSKKGVCLWRDTEYGKMFEYPHNINLYSELPLQMKFNSKDIVDHVLTLY
jgi:hypothetical protein